MYYEGNNYRLADHCVDIESCGTYSPIWLKGRPPNRVGEQVQNQLCANYNQGNYGYYIFILDKYVFYMPWLGPDFHVQQSQNIGKLTLTSVENKCSAWRKY